MRIDDDLTPIKYILGTEKNNEAYPNSTDIMWGVVNHAIRDGGKNADVFTLHFLNTRLFKGEDESRIESSVNRLVELGLVESIKQPGAKNAYKILQNPFE